MLTRVMRKLKMSKIGLQPPRPAAARHGIAIAAVLRNEARHIGEWARFHHAVGVRHFVIYDDASQDDTRAVLRAALPEDALTIIPWQQRLSDVRLGREVHNQILAYAHAASNFGADLRWMAFIDADEFLVPTAGVSLTEALAPLDAVPNLSLPWHMFGTSGHKTPPEGGMLRNFTRRVRDPMSDAPGVRAFKMLVDPCRVTAMRVHAMETDGGQATWNDAGVEARLDTRDRAAFYSTAAVQLNHYYTRSEAELEAKITRGPNLVGKADAYRRKVLRTVENIEADTVEDTVAKDLAARLGL